ncbi:MAG: cytochrome c [Syntrophales bacterium]|nr:cytochrome c [Syntrophales bacterium]
MKKSIAPLIGTIVLGITLISFDANAQMGSLMMGLLGFGSRQGVMSGGTAWGTGVFRSNGERIYFTTTSERGTAITYTDGPLSSGWMMMGGQLVCVSCHGPNGRGGKHNMGMMQVMDAKDIRWSVLQREFDAEKFRLAVVKGQDPDGTKMKLDMPRWNISNEDLADLIAFLKTLP